MKKQIFIASTLIIMLISGCSHINRRNNNNGIERETFDILNKNTFSVGLETGKRTSKSLMTSRLMREITKTCSNIDNFTILNKEYAEHESIKELVITFRCFF